MISKLEVSHQYRSIQFWRAGEANLANTELSGTGTCVDWTTIYHLRCALRRKNLCKWAAVPRGLLVQPPSATWLHGAGIDIYTVLLFSTIVAIGPSIQYFVILTNAFHPFAHRRLW